MNATHIVNGRAALAMPPQVVTVRNAGKVAAALQNKNCQRILEHLSKHKDANETAIAKSLGMPTSTVHYTIKLLADAKLVLGDHYTYSSRGKQVIHYRTNPNPIIIVQEERALDAISAIVPAAVIAAGAGIAYWFATKTSSVAVTAGAEGTAQAPAAGPMLKAATLSAINTAADSAPAATQAANPFMQALPAFLIGIALTVILSIVFALIMRRRRAGNDHEEA